MNAPDLFTAAAERQAYVSGRAKSQVLAEIRHPLHCKVCPASVGLVEDMRLEFYCAKHKDQAVRACFSCGYAHQAECRPGTLFAIEDERERRGRAR